VDDEPHVVGGLSLHLRRRYDVELATSAQAGLELLDRLRVAVVISDMRMPGMNGAEFLARASASHPETTRVLLTGYAEVDAARRAINEGQVFRFLIKPCPPPELLRTVEAAAELHRTVVTEKELVEQTARGSVKVLVDVLAATNPGAFGRAYRVKQLVGTLLAQLGEAPSWQLEVAAQLSQLPSLALPSETVEKLYYGAPLSSPERALVERAPDVTQHLLGYLPKLELVRRILAALARPDLHRIATVELEPEERFVRRGAQLLRAAIQVDLLETQGMTGSGVALAIKAHSQDYPAELLEALLSVCARRNDRGAVRELPAQALELGMILAADVKKATGALFAARGCEVTSSMLEKFKNLRPGTLREPLEVFEGAAEKGPSQPE
jgi:CheY-like chemotaxis protein